MSVDSLRFTLPLVLALSRSCAGGTDPARAPQTYSVVARVQSETYVAMRPAMEIDPSVFAALWPTVVAEAAPVVVYVGVGVPGEKILVVVPSRRRPTFYQVFTRNPSPSCGSNFAAKP